MITDAGFSRACRGIHFYSGSLAGDDLLRTFIFLPLLLMAGCNSGPTDLQAKDCHELIKYLAKSPSTVDYVRTTYHNLDPEEKTVSVDIDSQNGYGATVRSQVTCIYPKVDGEPVEIAGRVKWDGQPIGDQALAIARVNRSADNVSDLMSKYQ